MKTVVNRLAALLFVNSAKTMLANRQHSLLVLGQWSGSLRLSPAFTLLIENFCRNCLVSCEWSNLFSAQYFRSAISGATWPQQPFALHSLHSKTHTHAHPASHTFHTRSTLHTYTHTNTWFDFPTLSDCSKYASFWNMMGNCSFCSYSSIWNKTCPIWLKICQHVECRTQTYR